MARFGRNEQLVIAGSAAVFAAYALGMLLPLEWPFNLSAGTILVASLVAFLITFLAAGRGVAGLPPTTIVRIAAALVGAFVIVDVGNLMSSLDQWEGVTIALTIVYAIGAAILAFGAWAVSGGSLPADAQGLLGAMRLAMADRFVYLGALGVIVAWFLIMVIADVFNFTSQPMVVVFLATLVLVVRWLGRNPGAGRLALPAPWTLVGLAGLTVVVGLWWLAGIIGPTIDRDLLDLTSGITLALYLLALVSLGFGAYLSIGAAQTTQPTQPAA